MSSPSIESVAHHLKMVNGSTAQSNMLHQNQNLNVYPNPTSHGIFNISVEGEILSVSIIDLTGRVLEIPVDLKRGVIDGSKISTRRYVMQVKTNHGQIFRKVLVVTN